MDEERHPRLADFGLTILADATQQYSTDRGGTARFVAPELLNPLQFNKTFQRTFESDIYAYACVCVEVSGLLGLSTIPEHDRFTLANPRSETCLMKE